jgi:type I restriction enzyme S subunit
VGRAAIWNSEIEECYYQKALHRIRPQRRGEDPRFLWSVLRVAVQQGVFIACANPNTVFHLTAEMLRAHRFPFPPSREQSRIVEHLASCTTDVDRSSAALERQIELLREYRQALITAAVTGKLDLSKEAC